MKYIIWVKQGMAKFTVGPFTDYNTTYMYARSNYDEYSWEILALYEHNNQKTCSVISGNEPKEEEPDDLAPDPYENVDFHKSKEE